MSGLMAQPTPTAQSSRGSSRGSTAYAALVLLAFGDASGYELKQRADSTLRFFFNAPAMSQIYSELDRLAVDGLVDALGELRGDRETKRFRLTDAGRDELRRWLADDGLPATVFKSHLALRIVVGYLADSDRIRADIDLERARVRADLDDLDAVRDLLDPADQHRGWAWLVANWGDRYYRDMLTQLDDLRANLDDPAGRFTPAHDRRLDGPTVSLVPATPAHYPAVRAIRAEPAVSRVWSDVPGPHWPDDPDIHGYAIVEDEHDVIGWIQWGEETDPMYHHASIDIFVATEHHGRGKGTEAIRLLAAHLLDERGVHRLVIDPAADNAPAIACYRKVGFREVGVMRQYEQGADGTFHDGLLMELLAEELT